MMDPAPDDFDEALLGAQETDDTLIRVHNVLCHIGQVLAQIRDLLARDLPRLRP